MSIPTSTILVETAAPQNLHMLTREFLSDDGALNKLNAAVDGLKKTVPNLLKSKQYNCFPGLDHDQTYGVLFGHWGLQGEFGNGITSVANHALSRRNFGRFFDCLNKKSQLLIHACSEPDHGARAIVEALEGYISRTETARQAFTRIHDMINTWITLNEDILPKDVSSGIKENLQSLQDALEGVDIYAQSLEHHIAQHERAAAK